MLSLHSINSTNMASLHGNLKDSPSLESKEQNTQLDILVPDDVNCNSDENGKEINKDDNNISRNCQANESNNNNITAELKRSAEIFIDHLLQMGMNGGEANISKFLNGKCEDDEIANKIKDIYVRLTTGNIVKNLEARVDNVFEDGSRQSSKNSPNNQMDMTITNTTRENKQIMSNCSEENLDKLTIKLPMEQSCVATQLPVNSIEHPISKKRTIDSMNDITPLNLVVQKKAKPNEYVVSTSDTRNKTESFEHSVGNKTFIMSPANVDAAPEHEPTICELHPNARLTTVTSPRASPDKIVSPSTTPSSNINSTCTNNVIKNDEPNEIKKIQKSPVTFADYILSEFGILAPKKAAKCDSDAKHQIESCKTDLTQDKSIRKQCDDIGDQMKNCPRTNDLKALSIRRDTMMDVNTESIKSAEANIQALTNEVLAQKHVENSGDNSNGNRNAKQPSGDNPLNENGKGITPESQQLIKEFYKLVEDTIARQEQINLDKSNDSTNSSQESDTIDENVFMKETTMTQDKNGKVLYNCTRCNVSFPHLTDLQMHTFTHYRKRHRCPACSKEFQNLSGVKRHMIIHTRLKPFSCPKCDRAFNLSTNLRKHYQRMHGSKLQITSTRRNSTGNAGIDNNNKQENNQIKRQEQNGVQPNLYQFILPQTTQDTCLPSNVPSTQANHLSEEQSLRQLYNQTLPLSATVTNEHHLSHISPIRVVTSPPIRVVTSPNTSVPSTQIFNQKVTSPGTGVYSTRTFTQQATSPNAGVSSTQTQQATGESMTPDDYPIFLSSEIKQQLGPEALLKIHLPRLKSLQSQITERVNKLGEQFRLVKTGIPNDEIQPYELSPSSKYPSDDNPPPWKSLDYVPSHSASSQTTEGTTGSCQCVNCPNSIYKHNNNTPVQVNRCELKTDGYQDALYNSVNRINGRNGIQQLPNVRVLSPPQQGRQPQRHMSPPIPGPYGNIQIGTPNISPTQLQNIPIATNTPDRQLTFVRLPASTACNVESSGKITTVIPNRQLPVNKPMNSQIQHIQTLDRSNYDPRNVNDIWKYFALIHRDKSKVPQLPAKLLSPSLLPRQMQTQQFNLSTSPILLESKAPSPQRRYSGSPQSVFDVEKMSEVPLEPVQNKTNDLVSVPLDLSLK